MRDSTTPLRKGRGVSYSIDMTDEIVWALDVDGVLSARRHAWPDRIVRKTLSVHIPDHGYESYRLAWAPSLINAVSAISRHPHVKIVWATSWCPHAHRLEELWDLGPFDRGWNDDLHGDALADAKIGLVDDLLSAGHRVIWTDDDYADNPTSDDRLLAIKPDPKRGLTPVDIDTVTKTIDEWSRWSR